MILYITKPNLRSCGLGNKLIGAEKNLYLNEPKASGQLRLLHLQKNKQALQDVSSSSGANNKIGSPLHSPKTSNMVYILSASSSHSGLLRLNSHSKYTIPTF